MGQYSDHDIFVREMVSNEKRDAITKLKKLDMMGEYQLPDGYKPSIKIEVNPEEKTLKFTDNGIGMTADGGDILPRSHSRRYRVPGKV